MNNYCVRLVPLPATVKACTVLDSNDFYNIYINKDMPESIQREAFKHEMIHIHRGDFERNVPIEEIENIPF